MSDFSILPDYLRTQAGTLLIVICLYFLIHFIKILRLFLLMKFSGFIKSSFIEFVPIACIAVAISYSLPFKTGELAGPKLYTDHFDVSPGHSFSVIVASKIFDVLCTVPMVTLVLFQQHTYDIFELLIFFYTIIFISTIGVAALISRSFGQFLISFLKKHIKGPLAKLVNKIEVLLTEYYDSLNTILKPFKAKISFIITTIARWSVEIFAWYLILQSFNFNLSIMQVATFLALVIIVGVATGAPGGFGTPQLTGVGILIIYGAKPEIASIAMIVGISLVTVSYLSSGGFGLAVFFAKSIFIHKKKKRHYVSS